MKILTQKRLKECLSYDPETGVFLWKVSLNSLSRVGAIAGRICNGQRQIGLDYELYSAANLAWLYMTGELPENFIDHIDRNGDNNKFTNLREATRTQNAHNRRAFKNGTSGYKGVTAAGKSGRWRSQITINKVFHSPGVFNLKESAALAYDLAAHEHFGEFAVLNFPTAPSRDWILI